MNIEYLFLPSNYANNKSLALHILFAHGKILLLQSYWYDTASELQLQTEVSGGINFCFLGKHQFCYWGTCDAEEPLGLKQKWSINCLEATGTRGLAEGADIVLKAIFDLKYKEEERTLCHISPKPSVSPLLMGRSDRSSNSHSFTGMVSLSTRQNFKND